MNTRDKVLLGSGALATTIGLGGALTYAALSAGSQLFGRTLIAGRNPLEIALTFDDGPNAATTEALLDLLALHSTRATFFMIGSFVRCQPALARRVHAAGHVVGNHTETHPWLPIQPAHKIRAELRACNQALEDALGAPVRYFRPPHGARRPIVIRAALELGLRTVQWNVMAEDWKPIGPARILANVEQGITRCKQRGTGVNILLHDGGHRALGADRSDTLRVTEELLTRCSRTGSRFVTVDAWA